jgi:hypothetical protein
MRREGKLAVLAVALWASGCLLMADKPEFIVTCWDGSDCPAGQICNWISYLCEERCKDADCAGGYGCDTGFNECNDGCIFDADCKSGYHCCEYDEREAGQCDNGECVPN